MGRVAASTSVRLLWAAALMAVVGTLAVTTTAAAAASSCGCCCPCERGASVRAAADFVEMDGTVRTKPRPMEAKVDAAKVDAAKVDAAKVDAAKVDAADLAEMDDTARTKPCPMGGAVDAGGKVETMVFSTFIAEAVIAQINLERLNTGNVQLTISAKLEGAAQVHTDAMVNAGEVLAFPIASAHLVNWGAIAAEAVALRRLVKGNANAIANELVTQMLGDTRMRRNIYSGGWDSIGCVAHQDWTKINYLTCVYAKFP